MPYNGAELIAELATGADPSLVVYKDEEVLTTRIKKVDNTKVVEHLNHRSEVSLEEGVYRTVEWMRGVYLDRAGQRHPAFDQAPFGQLV